MSDTPLLGLPLLEASQAQKHVTHNEALLLLDGLLHLAVIARTLAAPPAAPADGDRYLVAASATGDWQGHSGQIAIREAGNWRFAIPKAGWRLWVAAEAMFLLFDGTDWFDVQGFDELQNLALLGVNTTADAANKLAVSSPNILFNHAGADSRVKINKNAAANTASLLFQSGFSGRAEFGLAGDDDFHVKVSPDGSAFFESFIVSRTSGLITIRNGFVLEPQSADPASPADGQLWYNSTAGTFRKRQNGATSDLDTGGGGGVGDGDKGDIIVSGGGTVWSIDGTVLTTFGRTLIDDADAAAARATLGLGNVDNTSDAAKPISTATQTALDLKATLASPALTGTPTAPTAAPGTNTTQLSTTAFVKAAVDAAGGGGSPTFSRLAKWQAVGNAATVSVSGAANLTATGTATIVNTGIGSLVDRIRRVEYLVTVAAAAAVAGWRGGDRMWTIGDNSIATAGGFTFTCEWATATGQATSTTRCFVGLLAGTAAPTDVEPSSLTNMAGMGWDAADTNIQIMCNDGAGTASKVDLGASFPVPSADRADVYLIKLVAAPGTTQQVAYTVTNISTGAVASGTLTTDLPGTSSTLAPRGWMSVGGTSSVIGIALGEMSMESSW